MFSDKTASEVIDEKGLRQISDTSELEGLVRAVLSANEKQVADYRGGKTNILGYLIGQCMRASKGKGNPELLRELILKEIG